MSKEIITLQLGSFANHVGAQFWNIQGSAFVYDNEKEPEVDNDILFREGLTHNGTITYTPRLILADLKGGFGTVKLNGELYEDDQTIEEIEEEFRDNIWSENSLSTHVTESYSALKEKKNNVSSLSDETGEKGKSWVNEDCKNWSDYMEMPLHPNSTVVVQDYLYNSDQQEFNLWSQGSSHKILEEFEENIRYFAEECDNLQGFHVLFDINNGFGGLSHFLGNYLNDEFMNKCVSMFPLQPTLPNSESVSSKLRSAITSSLTIASLLESSTSITPLSLFNDFVPNHSVYRKFPLVLYDVDSNYHASAILSSTLENLTLNYRTHSSNTMMQDYFLNLTPGRRNLLSTGVSFPFPLSTTQARCSEFSTNFADSLVNEYQQNTPWNELMPSVDLNSQCIAQNISLRGLAPSLLLPSSNSQSHKLMYKCNHAEDMLQLYVQDRFHGCKSYIGICKEPLIISKRFPKIFSGSIQWNGLVHQKPNLKTHFMNNFSTNGSNGIHPKHNAVVPLGSDYSMSNSNGAQHNGCTNHNSTATKVFNDDEPSINSVPVLSTLQCSTGSSEYIKQAKRMLSNCKRSFVREQHKLEAEEYSQFAENLDNILDLYILHNNLPDNSDDDSV